MNELAFREDVFNGESVELVSSFDMSTPENRLKVLKYTNTPDHRLKDFINMDIVIKDIYIEAVSVLQEEKDEDGNDVYQKCPRTIIVDDKGDSYVAVSFGVFNAIKRIVTLLGNPHSWEKPIKFKVKQIAKGDRAILTFEPVLN